MQFKTYLLIFHIVFRSAEALSGVRVRNARVNEFPFVVSIGYAGDVEPEKNHFCTGSLITDRHVLTAAHCIEDEELDNVRVSVGSIDLRHTDALPVRWWKTYEKWADENDVAIEFVENDVAILELTYSVGRQMATPGRLSTKTFAQLAGERVNIAGWGTVSDGSSPVYLQTAEVTVLSNIQCTRHLTRALGESYGPPKNFLCTIANPRVHTECGDSGGPLISRDGMIIGVNKSRCPSGEFTADTVNFQTAVYYYRNYMIDVMQY